MKYKLCIKKSNIKGAGNGVFALEKIPPKSLLGQYKGKLYLIDDIDQELDMDFEYSWALGEFRKWRTNDYKNQIEIGIVDASNLTYSNWTRYVNCSRNPHEENVEMKQRSFKIYYWSTRWIYPGEELLVWYGEEYAEELGIIDYH